MIFCSVVKHEDGHIEEIQSLGQRVELPIPEEELTTLASTTSSES